VSASGAATLHGDLTGVALNSPIISITATPDGGGHWLVAKDGGIFSFGDAKFYGSTGGMKLNAPVVALSTIPGGDGYYLVDEAGQVFAFGAADSF
jgi:ribosomal protein L24E